MFSQKINMIMIKLTTDHMTANVEGKERKENSLPRLHNISYPPVTANNGLFKATDSSH